VKSSKVKPFLSIVIPAHNEMLRLPATLNEVARFIKTQAYHSEVLVVENASTDNTYDLAMEMCKTIPQARVLREPVKGKGQAVKCGMLAARGEYCLIFDADLAMPVNEIPKFIPPLLIGCDIAIASRETSGAKRYHEPLYRHLIGRAFNFLVRMLVLPGLQDTQCGYKCFKSGIIESIFNRQTMTGWAFDVELLAIARQLGYSIKEMPIEWYYGSHSRVNIIVDAPRMFADLLAIRSNVRKGIYK
jgi:glycosyltransferase involved in cell wall biosynthesis